MRKEKETTCYKWKSWTEWAKFYGESAWVIENLANCNLWLATPIKGLFLRAKYVRFLPDGCFDVEYYNSKMKEEYENDKGITQPGCVP